MRLLSGDIEKAMGSSSFIRKMFEKGIELKKKFGEDAVFDFSLGNPDVPPPAKTKVELERIAAEAVKPLGLGYCPNAGIASVREAMAAYLSRQQNADVGPDNVVMTVGAAGAMVSFFRAVIEPGDEIITPAPYFVEYGSYCGHFGGVLKPVPSIPPTFRPDVSAIAAAVTPRTRAVIVNSPNNPTGCIYSAEDMQAIAAVVEAENRKRGEDGRPLYLLSDEPYRAFAFDGAVVPPVLPLTKEKFKKEAQAAAKLIHPNIAQIYSYGISKGMPYIAMELVAGGSLYSLMKANPGKTDIQRVIKICQQTAMALQCATDQGFVHGDVKPENILLDANGNAKLVDFGLAAMQKDTSEIWGTPYYISPEKVKKEVVDFRADNSVC